MNILLLPGTHRHQISALASPEQVEQKRRATSCQRDTNGLNASPPSGPARSKPGHRLLNRQELVSHPERVQHPSAAQVRICTVRSDVALGGIAP
jgi:hypothetical protein